jgi:hypothetical protein
LLNFIDFFSPPKYIYFFFEEGGFEREGLEVEVLEGLKVIVLA